MDNGFPSSCFIPACSVVSFLDHRSKTLGVSAPCSLRGGPNLSIISRGGVAPPLRKFSSFFESSDASRESHSSLLQSKKQNKKISKFWFDQHRGFPFSPQSPLEDVLKGTKWNLFPSSGVNLRCAAWRIILSGGFPCSLSEQSKRDKYRKIQAIGILIPLGLNIHTENSSSLGEEGQS